MDFAADAVMDVIAPPQRAANAKAAPDAAPDSTSDPAQGPSFEDCLEAAVTDTGANEAPAETNTAEPERSAQPRNESAPCAVDAHTEEGLTAAPDAIAAPLLLQMIVAAPAAATFAGEPPATPTPTSTASPAEASAPTPAPQTPPLQTRAPRAHPHANAAKSQRADGKGESSGAPPQQSEASPAATVTPRTAPASIATPAAPLVTPAAPAAAPDVAASASALAAERIIPNHSTLEGAPSAKENAARATPRLTQVQFEAPAVEGEITPDPSAAQKSTPTRPAAAAFSNRENAAPAAPAFASESASAPSAPGAPGALQAAAPPQAQHAALEHESARGPAPAAAQVGHEIVRRFTGDGTRFELRLDPPELGRVEVRLDVSRDHRVTATVSADNPQALTELARHARELQETLQSAGLELADGGLSFDLRQGGGHARDADEAQTASSTPASGDEDAEQLPAARPLGFERWRGLRVDVMA